MAAQTGFAFNPLIASLSPNDQQTLMQLQQRQAIGQALLQQGMQPMDNGSAPVGGVAYHVSPLNGISKMLNAYVGNKLSMDSMGQQAQLMSQMYGNAFGTNPSSSAGAAPAQPAPAQSVDAGGIAGGGSGDGVQSFPVPMSDAQPSGPQLGAAMVGAPQVSRPTAPGGSLTLPGYTPQQSMQLFGMLGPEAYGKLLESRTAPTDATRMAWAAGMDPSQANAGALFKANYVPPVQIGANETVMDPRNGSISTTPAAAPAGAQNILGADGKWYAVPVQGGTQAVQAASAATAAGAAQFKPVQVYNAATHQMEYSNEAAVANPGTPAPARNNNPGALMPGGKLATYPDMQTGLAALDSNLQSYGKQGISTVSGVISKWAPPNENDTQAYIQDVSQRLGIKPDQKIDLSNPLVRQSLSTAIALHENGPQGVFGTGQPAPGAGGVAAAPPLGAQAAAEAQAKGQIDTMQKSYQNLQTVRSGAPAALQDVDNMTKLAQGASLMTVGPAAAKFAGLFSANAAEYEKSRDNLVTNLGSQLGINSDAARDLVYGSIPSYGAPKQAVQNGLQTLRGQIQTRLLKSDFLSNAYAAGDAKAYNQQENAFDQHITPAAANQISMLNAMPPGAAKGEALKALKGNPAFEWAAQNGVLR